MPPTAYTATQRLLWVCAMLLALLVSQGTAGLHAVQHGPEHAAQPHAGVVADPSAGAVASADFWGHETGSASCALWDHLLGGQAPGQACSALPAAAPMAGQPPAALEAPAFGQMRRAHQARGPPAA